MGCNSRVTGIRLSSSRPDSTEAAQLQEALDVLLRQFDHPSSISVYYEYVDGRKQSTFEVETVDGTDTYELVYDGLRDDVEPERNRVD